MVNPKEGEPVLTRRQMFGEAVFWAGFATSVGSILGYAAEQRISKAEADASVPPSPVRRDEYEAAQKFINQSDKTILSAVNEERYGDIPTLIEERKKAKWEIAAFESRQKDVDALTSQIRTSYEPITYALLTSSFVGIIGAFTGFFMRVSGQPPIKPLQPENQSR